MSPSVSGRERGFKGFLGGPGTPRAGRIPSPTRSLGFPPPRAAAGQRGRGARPLLTKAAAAGGGGVVGAGPRACTPQRSKGSPSRPSPKPPDPWGPSSPLRASRLTAGWREGGSSPSPNFPLTGSTRNGAVAPGGGRPPSPAPRPQPAVGVTSRRSAAGWGWARRAPQGGDRDTGELGGAWARAWTPEL